MCTDTGENTTFLNALTNAIGEEIVDQYVPPPPSDVRAV
jgi:hypothetical protein